MDSKIYIVTPPRKAKYAEAMPIRPKYDDVNIEHCPECGANLQLSKWIGEKTIRINKKDIPDFMYIYGGSDNWFVISEKAYHVLMDNQVTGLIGAEKINKILYKKEIVEQPLYEVLLERRLYPIDHNRSRIIYGEEHPEKICRVCNPLGRTRNVICGLYFKPNIQIDLDIFKIYEMTSSVFISERFVRIVEDNHLTGLHYEYIHEYNSARIPLSEEQLLMLDMQPTIEG